MKQNKHFYSADILHITKQKYIRTDYVYPNENTIERSQ